jgi:hypothetical protein
VSQPGHPLESIITPLFTGFPAADYNIREFFNKGTSSKEVYTRYAAFFTALFQQLLILFKSNSLNRDKTQTENYIAGEFRSYMTEKQTYDKQNSNRVNFYEEVCIKAENVRNGIYTVIRCSYCILCRYLTRNFHIRTNERMSP